MIRCNKKVFRLMVEGMVIASLISGCGAIGSHKTELDMSSSETTQENILETEKTEDEKYGEETAAPDTGEAVDLKGNCEKLIQDIELWEYECLYWFYYEDISGNIDFTKNNMERARLATLITEVEVGDFEDEITVDLPEADVQASATKIFNQNVNIVDLPDDDYMIKKGNNGGEVVAQRMLSVYDDEGLYHVFSQDISESGDGYDVLQKLYCGYWGGYDEENANYNVTIHLRKDDSSYYGVVLDSMRFEKVELPEIYMDNTDYTTPFYGIWCCGVKDESEAEVVRQDLLSKGFFEAQTFISSDWTNLNSDKWYVVTAGIYSEEATAYLILDTVKAEGYGDAYVKYTGEYKNQ